MLPCRQQHGRVYRRLNAERSKIDSVIECTFIIVTLNAWRYRDLLPRHVMIAITLYAITISLVIMARLVWPAGYHERRELLAAFLRSVMFMWA